MMSIVMDLRLFFTITINVRWLHIVITNMLPPIRRKNRAPHILIIVVVKSLFLLSSSSLILVSSSSSRYPHRHILILLVLSRDISLLSYSLLLYCILIVDRHRVPRGPVHLEASCTSTLTSVCIWDTSYRLRPFANGNRRGILPGLKTIYKREVSPNGQLITGYKFLHTVRLGSI